MSGLTKAGTLLALSLTFLLVSQEVAGVERLSFSHRLHIEDAELTCADCHAIRGEGESMAGYRRAGMQACANCHDIEDDAGCTLCHSDKEISPSYDLPSIQYFSHVNHSGDRFDCAACHPGVAQSETLDALPLPASGACGDCHAKEGIKPSDHTFDWEHHHGPRATLDSQSCDLCHQEQQDCLTCHEGDNLSAEKSPHPLSYLYSHGPDARLESTRCESCHRDQVFCMECHASYSVKPLFHDKAGWLSGAHGAEARRDLGQCILCHEEAEASVLCGSCHN
ncbi:MAG: hypothetical protein KJ970_01450 [Candidatus Eisenbacteria bacterium]|uniref:Cytochrome c7-like domain-containing protein n=1 Tax=Eiseniibacteriota bacterium TaxID=2212470 RepID=A0A948RRA7_UNCEI|nr:hypothetical protein [Candidatus Eisenbacteria bacterium]MBU1949412.1 hypothetical protein [Candidatus Eisenbacteria bacterium]MBU2689568.1 hypothetical protein [Candidatus Eisenbacteria bacterium]